MTLGARVERRHLLAQCHRLILVLLEQLGQARPALELVASRAVEVGGELGKRCQLSVLREVEAQLAGHLPHGLGLSVASYARHADADVEGRALAGVEEVRLQVDLAVGDRDHVRRDEGRDVVRLCLDHWQRG